MNFQKSDLCTLGQSNNPLSKSFVYKFSINFECPGLFLETSKFFVLICMVNFALTDEQNSNGLC